MMNRNSFVPASALILVSLLTAVVSSQEPRRVVLRQQQPLLASLRPDDRHVVMELALPRPQKAGPVAGEIHARLWGSTFNAVLGVRVQSVLGMPMKLMVTPPTALEYKTWLVPAAEDRADRIGSTVTARVEIVLTSTVPGIDVGALIQFQERYGKAVIRGVTVEYGIPWLRPLVEGRRYLLFASVTPEGAIVREEAYEETKPGAWLSRTYLDADVRPHDEFERLTYDAALLYMRSALGQL